MAETTTMTWMPRGGAKRACGMEHASAREENCPNFEGDEFLCCLLARRRDALAPATRRASFALILLYGFSRLMTALLAFLCDSNRWSVSGGGLKKKTHRQVASWGGLETFC